jgi:drug/metabolite transporter (DMT)-like permease
MTLDALIILAGSIVAVLPFLGFPSSWNHALFFIAGLCVIALGIVVRRRLNKSTDTQQLPFDGSDTENR